MGCPGNFAFVYMNVENEYLCLWNQTTQIRARVDSLKAHATLICSSILFEAC